MMYLVIFLLSLSYYIDSMMIHVNMIMTCHGLLRVV